MASQSGTLYIVATPIGNLEDISARALRILEEVDMIAAEDTRHSNQLLAHFGIAATLISYHDFNERECERNLLTHLTEGKSIALVSDAGTPLINDPGYRIVKTAHLHGIKVVPIPGPSALICALSAGGLPTDRFVFEGYPPERQTARLKYLHSLRFESRTIVIYETPHRMSGFIQDAVQVFGPGRHATIARELTKKFESISTGTLQDLMISIQNKNVPLKGEFVILIEGAAESLGDTLFDSKKILGLLMTELPLKKAASITSQITGMTKNDLYDLGLTLQAEE